MYKYKRMILPPSLIILIIFILSVVGCPAKNYKIDFERKPCIQPHTDYTYKLCNDLHVSVNNEHFIIPKGFETDLASIPRWYWIVLSPQYSAFVSPSIIHDYFYRCSNLKNRKYADTIFFNALLAQNVSIYTASKFYYGVRIFGAHSYVKDKDCAKKTN